MKNLKTYTPVILGLILFGSIFWFPQTWGNPSEKVLGKNTALPNQFFEWHCYPKSVVKLHYPCLKEPDATTCSFSFLAKENKTGEIVEFTSRREVNPSLYKQWLKDWKAFDNGKVCIAGEIIKDNQGKVSYYIFERIQNDKQCLSFNPGDCP